MTNIDEKAGEKKLLTFYAVFATKNLREIIDNEIFESLKRIFEEVRGDAQVYVTDWLASPYYMALVAKVGIMSGLPAILRKFKKQSDRQIVEEFPRLREQLQGDNFWMAAFCCVPEGPKARKLLEDYVDSARKAAKTLKYSGAGA